MAQSYPMWHAAVTACWQTIRQLGEVNKEKCYVPPWPLSGSLILRSTPAIMLA